MRVCRGRCRNPSQAKCSPRSSLINEIADHGRNCETVAADWWRRGASPAGQAGGSLRLSVVSVQKSAPTTSLLSAGTHDWTRGAQPLGHITRLEASGSDDVTRSVEQQGEAASAGTAARAHIAWNPLTKLEKPFMKLPPPSPPPSPLSSCAASKSSRSSPLGLELPE